MQPETREKGVVWITGAAGGLGMALTGAFAAGGWNVAAAGHTTVPDSDSQAVWGFRMDVTQPNAIEAAVRGVLDRWGRLDVLINNAGLAHDRLLVQTDNATWDRILGVNLKGAFLCSQAALRPMMARRTGLILNIASFAARSGPAGQAAYAASKAGLIGLTLALAREVGPLGVRVNAVLPGVVPTRLTARVSEPVMQGFRAANVLGRLNRLDEVAAQVVDLAQPSGMSGQVIQLDSRISPWT